LKPRLTNGGSGVRKRVIRPKPDDFAGIPFPYEQAPDGSWVLTEADWPDGMWLRPASLREPWGDAVVGEGVLEIRSANAGTAIYGIELEADEEYHRGHLIEVLPAQITSSTNRGANG
jgi:hypothetical protein